MALGLWRVYLRSDKLRMLGLLGRMKICKYHGSSLNFHHSGNWKTAEIINLGCLHVISLVRNKLGSTFHNKNIRHA